MDGAEGDFGVVNYCVFGATLAISFGIGIASAYKGNKSPEEFLVGNRSLGTIPVSMSLLSTFVSAVSYIGYTTEVYTYGMQISVLAVGIFIGILFAMFVTLPVIFPLKLISVHEYIELRFKSSLLRFFMMLLILLNAVTMVGVVLYATAVALATVTPLSYVTNIFLIGLVCTIYSAIGGIRAVVWTDVFQCTVMVSGLILVVVVGIIQVGGVTEVFAISSEGKRINIFNMNPSIYERHSFYNIIILGGCRYAAAYGISQVNVQRMCAVSSIQKARKVLVINAFGMMILHFLICLGGLVTYAVYADCDPFLSGKIRKKEEILTYFVKDKLGFIPGIPGVMVAVLMASTLSSVSSVVNAQAAIIWEDFLSKLRFLSSVTPAKAALINKILTFIVGSAFIGMAFLVSETKSLIQMFNSVGGIIFGSIFGVFLLGMCFPRCTAKGAWCGLFISWSLLTWIFIGATMNVTLPDFLPLSVDTCEDVSIHNVTLHSLHYSTVSVASSNQSTSTDEVPLSNDSFLNVYVYSISYTLYSLIGPVLCITIGVLVSYITGPQDLTEVDSNLISPLVRRFYWKETEQTENIELRGGNKMEAN